MSRNWISFPLREGECSRQAHCDFPEGTYEREMAAKGFVWSPPRNLHHKTSADRLDRLAGAAASACVQLQ